MVTENEDGSKCRSSKGTMKLRAEIIAKKVLELADAGHQFDEIAILARLYRLMPLIEGLLSRRESLLSLSGFLYDRRDMKTAVAAIQYLLKGGQEKHWN